MRDRPEQAQTQHGGLRCVGADCNRRMKRETCADARRACHLLATARGASR
jgi:hypothetical protein